MATSGFTHDKPDFSGEWILNRQASTLSKGADMVQSGIWRIEHHEPIFRHKARFVFESDSREYEYELRTDVLEVVSAHEGGRTISSLQWDGDALVVTFRTQHAHGEMTVAFRNDLIDGGRRLRAVEQLRGTDHDQDNVWIFDRG